MTKPKRPRDPNQLAKAIVALAAGETTEQPADDSRNPHAVELARLGGLKGGKARGKALTGTQRSDAAQKAAPKEMVKNQKVI